MQDVLRELVKKWVDILALHHWEIEVEYVPPEAMDNHGKWGEVVERDYTYYVAHIKISQACPPNRLEDVVIHELLHIIVGEIIATTNLIFGAYISRADALLLHYSEETVVTMLERAFSRLLENNS